jgi:hypothetical protein
MQHASAAYWVPTDGTVGVDSCRLQQVVQPGTNRESGAAVAGCTAGLDHVAGMARQACAAAWMAELVSVCGLMD